MKDLKVVFMGTPDFSVPILKALIENCNVIGVVTQPDKEVGRNKEIVFSPIKKVALENNINVFQPIKIRTDYMDILKLNPDIIITCAYGQIIPKEILDYPKYKCINVHASLLPKYRGGAPIHHAIINGDKETGITIMYMAPGMDDGDIISQAKVRIRDDETTGELHDELQELGRKLLIETLPSIIEGTNKRIKQNEKEVSFAKIIKKEDEIIDFSKSAIEVYNKIRGLNPFPSAYGILNGKRIKIFKSVIEKNNSNEECGKIIKVEKDELIVKCGIDSIKILELQPEGKKKMDIKEFLNGVKKEDLLNKVFKW
ncbi:MAG: methionyl-tRNA formyltransferase [Bacilli bacterium]|nr:methionyl-tRNA formyltransferase [Bacilli bacterium]